MGDCGISVTNCVDFHSFNPALVGLGLASILEKPWNRSIYTGASDGLGYFHMITIVAFFFLALRKDYDHFDTCGDASIEGRNESSKCTMLWPLRTIRFLFYPLLIIVFLVVPTLERHEDNSRRFGLAVTWSNQIFDSEYRCSLTVVIAAVPKQMLPQILYHKFTSRNTTNAIDIIQNTILFAF